MACRRLVDKVAVVTGSTSGIGYAIAKRLANEGATVLISSRKEQNVEQAVKSLSDSGLKVEGTVCNVSKAKDRDGLIDRVLQEHGKLDILVSSVGSNPAFGPINMCSEELWGKIFHNNVISSALLAAKATPLLSQGDGDGNIVFVSSITGFCPAPFLGAYSVSKAALMSLTKALSMELAPSKIRVNCIAPGIIETNFSSALQSNKSLKKRILSYTPMGRFGLPEECAGAVAFLVSDDASYITGETISMNGGTPVRF